MAKASQRISPCDGFPCADINSGAYALPRPVRNPEQFRIMMISEAPPVDPADHFNEGPGALHFDTTALAFEDAGYPVASMEDLRKMGVYLTTAIKCAKTAYGIQTATSGA